jgi:hypothetical protein
VTQLNIPKTERLMKTVSEAYSKAGMHSKGLEAVVRTTLAYASFYVARMLRSNKNTLVQVKIIEVDAPLNEPFVFVVHLPQEREALAWIGGKVYKIEMKILSQDLEDS